MNHELGAYDHKAAAHETGLQAATALGEPAQLVLKRLVLQVDGSPVCALIPSDRALGMKKLALAFGGKTAR